MAKIAINGLGRIGRAALKIIEEAGGAEVVAVNDLIPPDNLAYLLRYDTVYGRWRKTVMAAGDSPVIGGRPVPVLAEQEPPLAAMGDLGVDLVLECTGALRREEDLKKHLAAGARLVVLSAAARTETVATVDEDTDVEDVRHMLIDRRIRRVPVMSGQRLAGIVSRGDVVARLTTEWACLVCGESVRGQHPPAQCPRCHAASDRFIMQDPTPGTDKQARGHPGRRAGRGGGVWPEPREAAETAPGPARLARQRQPGGLGARRPRLAARTQPCSAGTTGR